jgi:small subunit ribosomal protein S15
MYLTAENKKEIFKKYGKSEADTGSAEGQIAIFTTRINHLTQHLLTNKKELQGDNQVSENQKIKN